MKKKIALMLVVFSLCLCTVGCSNFDKAEAADFAFFCAETESSTYHRGAYISVYPQATNVSDTTFRYTGCQHGVGMSAELFCLRDGDEYVISLWDIQTSDVCRDVKYEIAPGETVGEQFSVTVPHDAPTGVYHLRINYKGLVGTVENVFVLVENPWDTPEEREAAERRPWDFHFGFCVVESRSVIKKGENVEAFFYITNTSGEDHVFMSADTGISSYVTVELLCQTADGEYRHRMERSMNDAEPQPTVFKARDTDRGYIKNLLPDDAPAGTYSVRLSYGDDYQVFTDVLTVVE